MLNPINIAGPDSRRKQLMQKLSQQAGQHGAVPMPPVAGHGSAAALGAGVNFKSPGMRALPAVQNTNGSNVLASILARLGVGGRAQANEVSGGPGAPIRDYGPNFTPPPAADPGNPIPVSGGPTAAAGSPGDAGRIAIGAPASLVHVPVPLSSTGPLPPAPTDPYAGMTGAGGATAALDASSYGARNIGGATELGGSSGPVPLGGGMYYDPNSGQVINLGGPSAGAASFGFGGRNIAS